MSKGVYPNYGNNVEPDEHSRAEAARRCQRWWENAKEAPPDFPYLVAKQIDAHGVRLTHAPVPIEYEDGTRARGKDAPCLLIPIRDLDGRIHCAETIHAGGEKNFEQGGKLKGNGFVLGTLPEKLDTTDLVLCAEGFATSASLHEATGLPIACCFCNWNLKPVAQALRGRFPGAQIVICGDHDDESDGKPKGIFSAYAAASACEGIAILPPRVGTDFNDMVCTEGLPAVAQFVRAELERGGTPRPATPKPAESLANDDSGEIGGVVLFSGGVNITECARKLFGKLAQLGTLFIRCNTLTECLRNDDGGDTLEIVKPDDFRSRAEATGKLYVYRAGENREPVLKRATMNGDQARALMGSMEARKLLPHVSCLLRCPILVTKGNEITALGRGYHTDLGGTLIVAGEMPPRMELDEARALILRLFDEFDFQTPGDHARAIAAAITPCLKLGGHLQCVIPIDVAEADQSQAGKGFRHQLNAAIYNERAYIVTQRQGGVGSLDESISAAIISGRPFICLDNIRGRIESAHLESLTTANGSFSVRVPHRGEIQVGTERVILQMTSNGLQTTRDLANRASICRIRKRQGYKYRDTLGELKREQPRYLGAVFSIVTHWLSQGRPRVDQAGHDFREWAETLGWFVQFILGDGASLMEGHAEAQERVSNPALGWLHEIGLAVRTAGRIGEKFTATSLAEFSDDQNIGIPGLRNPEDKERAARLIGSLMKRVFGDTEEGKSVQLEDLNVQRLVEDEKNTHGNWWRNKKYVFGGVSTPSSDPHKAINLHGNAGILIEDRGSVLVDCSVEAGQKAPPDPFEEVEI